MGFKRPQVRLLSLGPSKTARKRLECWASGGFAFADFAFWSLFGRYCREKIRKVTQNHERAARFPMLARSVFFSDVSGGTRRICKYVAAGRLCGSGQASPQSPPCTLPRFGYSPARCAASLLVRALAKR